MLFYPQFYLAKNLVYYKRSLKYNIFINFLFKISKFFFFIFILFFNIYLLIKNFIECRNEAWFPLSQKSFKRRVRSFL
jgi:hypothetical protein